MQRPVLACMSLGLLRILRAGGLGAETHQAGGLVILTILLERASGRLLQSPVPQVQPSGTQALELSMNLIPLHRQLVRLLGLRPEVGDGEALVEVRTKVEHDAHGEHDIDAELCALELTSRRLDSGKVRGGGGAADLEDFEVEAAHICVRIHVSIWFWRLGGSLRASVSLLS